MNYKHSEAETRGSFISNAIPVIYSSEILAQTF